MKWTSRFNNEKVKIGDKIRYMDKTGTIKSNAVYKTTSSSGLFYANVLWDDKEEVEYGFTLSHIGVQILVEGEGTKQEQCQHLHTEPCFVNHGCGHRCKDCGMESRDTWQGD